MYSKFLMALCATLALAVARAQTLPQPPELAARQYVLMDLSSGQVLAERNPDAPADPASLTKLMTAYLVFDALKAKKISLDQKVSVSTRAWEERKFGGSLMFIDTTMSPTVDELLTGMIVQSGNDASVALAELVGGSLNGFVELMNRQAQSWGLKNTQFRNATGLTEAGHKSSPRDLALIASKIIQVFPDFYPYYAIRQYTFNKIKQDNRNMLLGRDQAVDGMKTGYTDAAGYCLIASAAKDMPNGKRRLLTVVMGTASREARATESQKLLNWGWTAWDAVRLFEDGKPVAEVPVWKGASATAKLGVAGGAHFVTVPKGQGAAMKTVIQRTDPLVAPLVAGQNVGSLQVATATGVTIANVPLVVQDAVPLAGLLGRAWDALRLWVK